MIEWIIWGALVAPCVEYLVWELRYVWRNRHEG